MPTEIAQKLEKMVEASPELVDTCCELLTLIEVEDQEEAMDLIDKVIMLSMRKGSELSEFVDENFSLIRAHYDKK